MSRRKHYSYSIPKIFKSSEAIRENQQLGLITGQEELGTSPPGEQKEHNRDWETEVEVLELGQENQRVTDPSPIGRRRGADNHKDGERRTDRQRRDARCLGDPRESPEERGGRRSTGG